MVDSYRQAHFGLVPHGNTAMVPAIDGFSLNLYSNIERYANANTRGVLTSQVSVENTVFTTIIGVGHSPANRQAYIRMIAIHEMEGDNEPNLGLIAQGNPLSLMAPSGKGLILRKCSKNEIQMIEGHAGLIQTVLHGLAATSTITGASVNVEKLISAFESGMVNDLMASYLHGTHLLALRRWDPNSVESVDPYDFHKGLGLDDAIQYNAEPTFGAVQVRPHEPVCVTSINDETLFELIRKLDFHDVVFPIKDIQANYRLENRPQGAVFSAGDTGQLIINIGYKRVDNTSLEDANRIIHEPGRMCFRPNHGLEEVVVYGPYKNARLKRLGCTLWLPNDPLHNNWKGKHGISYDMLSYG